MMRSTLLVLAILVLATFLPRASAQGWRHGCASAWVRDRVHLGDDRMGRLDAGGGRPARPAVVPWVTYGGIQGPRAGLHVNYVTPRATESVILTATDDAALRRIAADAASSARARAGDVAYFARLGVTLRVARGRPPGRTTRDQIVSYVSTLHHHQLLIGEDTSYSVWDGANLSDTYRLPLPALEFTAVHVGHTSSVLPRPEEPAAFPAAQLELIRTTGPALVLHSGDVFTSVFDWERMKRESLDAFWPVLPMTPLLISPSNHDLGWPREADASEVFRYLFPYPYEGESLHYRVDYGGFRFVMVGYTELFQQPGAERAGRFIQDSIDSAKGPVVMVWGGSDRALWGTVDELSQKNPRLRLVLGGDGGRRAQRELSHGAWHVHNRVGSVIVARFTPQRIDLAVHRNGRVEGEIAVAVE